MTKHLKHLFLLAVALFSAAAGAQNNLDYTLGAGDAIRVQVFQNPDLTIEARVSETGTINYPLIGAVQLGGLTIGDDLPTFSSGTRSEFDHSIRGGDHLRVVFDDDHLVAPG